VWCRTCDRVADRGRANLPNGIPPPGPRYATIPLRGAAFPGLPGGLRPGPAPRDTPAGETYPPVHARVGAPTGESTGCAPERESKVFHQADVTRQLPVRHASFDLCVTYNGPATVYPTRVGAGRTQRGASGQVPRCEGTSVVSPVCGPRHDALIAIFLRRAGAIFRNTPTTTGRTSKQGWEGIGPRCR